MSNVSMHNLNHSFLSFYDLHHRSLINGGAKIGANPRRIIFLMGPLIILTLSYRVVKKGEGL